MRVMRLTVLALMLSSPAVLAAKKPVLVNAPPAVMKAVGAALGPSYAVVPLPASLGPTPTTKEVRAVTVPARAVALVQAEVGVKYVSLQVLSGDDGTPLDTIAFKPPKKWKALPADIAQQLRDALARGKAPTAAATPLADGRGGLSAGVTAAPPPPREAPPAAPSAELSGSSSAPPRRSAQPAFVTGVGFKGLSRSFAWAAGASEALASYSLPFAGAVAFDGTWYPGAHFTDGFAANVGAFINGEVGIGIASRQEDARFQTRADRFRFGARLRLPLGSRLQLDGALGYSTQTFAIAPQAAGTATPRPNIPSVTYTGPRAAVGASLQFGERVNVDALAGFMLVAGAGELATSAYFPKTSGVAADASLGLGVRLVDALRLRASFDWTGYFLSTNADPGASVTARGATDHFLGGTLSVLWVM
jgi:hypothetical protein